MDAGFKIQQSLDLTDEQRRDFEWRHRMMAAMTPDGVSVKTEVHPGHPPGCKCGMSGLCGGGPIAVTIITGINLKSARSLLAP